MVNLSVNEPKSRSWKNDLLTEYCNTFLLKPVMATCGITVSLFPDYSGTTSFSLQNFPEMNKLSICLGKSFFFSPGLCANFGQFQTKLEIVSVCTHDCVCVSMNVCLTVYMPLGGAEACVLTVSGVQTLISPFFISLSLSVMHHSYENEAETQRDRKLFLNNKRQPVCFQDLTLPLT